MTGAGTASRGITWNPRSSRNRSDLKGTETGGPSKNRSRFLASIQRITVPPPLCDREGRDPRPIWACWLFITSSASHLYGRRVIFIGGHSSWLIVLWFLEEDVHDGFGRSCRPVVLFR